MKSTPKLVAGAADIIGAVVALALLEPGESVIGINNFADYYPASLNEARVEAEGGKPTIRISAPMQADDMADTLADVSAIQHDLEHALVSTIDRGLPKFARGFWNYRGNNHGIVQ